ncbi:DUF4397 domain-containing protein [Marinobacter caseinilyticus]|uniref:DUF4397 domain-containing protein n=1 Tax=Marinobacter caseinilyticus TaxID=2692195 RepID=UPI0014074823|nr:DUF4397 domain-containing protein [Marinobacter caseinilyticus]
MFRKLVLVILTSLALVLAGCSDDDSDSVNATNTSLTVLHAVADAPSVNITADSKAVLTDVPFKSGATLALAAGTLSVGVDARLPDDTATTVIGPQSVELAEGKRYFAAAVGRVADSSLELLLLDQDEAGVASDEVSVRIAHLAANAPSVDIYVTNPGADISAVSPTSSASFKDDLGPVTLPAGDYQVRVTPQESKTVVYDSGTLTLAGGKRIFVGAVDNTHFGDAPISLIVEQDGAVIDVADADAGAGVRVVHNASGAGNVDVAVDGVVAITNLAFPDVAPGSGNDAGDYAALDAGIPALEVRPTGTLTVAASASPELANARAYTVLAANPGALEILPYEDDNRSIATEARLRIVHGAGTAPNVNVFLAPEGATTPGNTTAALTDVAYKTSSGYLDVPAGQYAVFVTTADNSVVIGPVNVDLQAGGVYTVVAREKTGGGFDLTTLDDF